MAADVSGITYFAPLLAFLIVFIILFALLKKTSLLGDETFIHLFISFIIATIFVSAAGVRNYVLTIVPWLAVLIIALFFILFLLSFVGKSTEFMHKGIGITFIILLAIVFLVSGFIVFSESIYPYLPGNYGTGDDPNLLSLLGWLYSGRVVGALSLVAVSALVSWVLVREKVKK